MTQDLKTIYANRLQGLKDSLISQDIKDACYELPISRTTYDLYMKGEITKLDTAIKLYEFLTKKIKSRLKEATA